MCYCASIFYTFYLRFLLPKLLTTRVPLHKNSNVSGLLLYAQMANKKPWTLCLYDSISYFLLPFYRSLLSFTSFTAAAIIHCTPAHLSILSNAGPQCLFICIFSVPWADCRINYYFDELRTLVSNCCLTLFEKHFFLTTLLLFCTNIYTRVIWWEELSWQ